jgi:GntR family transcriptional regulator
MTPFTLDLRPGVSVYRQILYAVKRAVIFGQLRPGDPFPSVRALSQELKINPNTAHKAIAALVAEGLLEVRPGIGTLVAEVPPASRAQRARLLERDVEPLVVEAKKLGLELADVLRAVEQHWRQTDDETNDGSSLSAEKGD